MRKEELMNQLAETQKEVDHWKGRYESLYEKYDYAQEERSKLEKKYNELVEDVDAIRKQYENMPTNCKLSKACDICVHSKSIAYDKLFLGRYITECITVCDLHNACPNFTARLGVEVKSNEPAST